MKYRIDIDVQADSDQVILSLVDEVLNWPLASTTLDTRASLKTINAAAEAMIESFVAGADTVQDPTNPLAFTLVSQEMIFDLTPALDDEWDEWDEPTDAEISLEVWDQWDEDEIYDEWARAEESE